MSADTYVPTPLRRPGWSKEHPKNTNPWSAERDVFSWLFSPMVPSPGRSIEHVIRIYREMIEDPPTLAGAGVLRRWLARNDAPCAHGVQRRLHQCPACIAQFEECVAYLEALREEVRAFYHSRDYWLSLGPYEFEAAVAKLFREMGFDAEVTRGSGDGGVDVLIRRGPVLVVVQCKQYRNPVGPAVARELLGAMAIHGAQRAILVCTGGFTGGVHQLAGEGLLRLYDLDGLVGLQRAVASGGAVV